MAFGDPAPMKRDTIFRIASLTKPITAVAAMILVEECKLRLDESIEPWLPELANRRVLKSISSQLDDTVPALRAITVRDLLTYRMGFGSVMAMPDTYPIQKLIREYRIGGDGPPLPSQAPGTEEWLQKLGSLPWMAQPGERWMYHVSSDVLGVLIARVSGQSLGTFLRERIFDPLGMKDTAFHVPPDKIERLPAFYFLQSSDEHAGCCLTTWRTAHGGPEPPFESGGGGLVSTIDDYFAFSRMMLNKGRHGREQILSRAAVELMTSDQLTPEQRAGSEIFFGTYSQLGLRNGGGHSAQRDLPHSRPIRLGRRPRHIGVHRSRRRNDRHPLHAAHDGFAGTAQSIHRLLDTGVRSNGIGGRRRECWDVLSSINQLPRSIRRESQPGPEVIREPAGRCAFARNASVARRSVHCGR